MSHKLSMLLCFCLLSCGGAEVDLLAGTPPSWSEELRPVISALSDELGQREPRLDSTVLHEIGPDNFTRARGFRVLGARPGAGRRSICFDHRLRALARF